MRRYQFLVVNAALVFAASVPIAAQEKTFEETVSLASGGTLALEADRGSTQLTSWDQPQVEIHARIEPPSGVDDDYARRAVEGTTIEVTTSNNAVRVRADYSGVPRRGWNRRVPRVHYEIRAPRELNLDVQIDRSDATIEGFAGRMILELDRSDLRASDLTGEITIDLDRSGLEVNDLAGQVALRLDRGRSVALDGVRASLDLDVDRTNVTMHDVWIDDDSRVEIDRGDLVVELDASQTLTIEANLSRRGDFSSDLPISVHKAGRDFSGTINGGGPMLQIRADRSEVQLSSH